MKNTSVHHHQNQQSKFSPEKKHSPDLFKSYQKQNLLKTPFKNSSVVNQSYSSYQPFKKKSQIKNKNTFLQRSSVTNLKLSIYPDQQIKQVDLLNKSLPQSFFNKRNSCNSLQFSNNDFSSLNMSKNSSSINCYSNNLNSTYSHGQRFSKKQDFNLIKNDKKQSLVIDLKKQTNNKVFNNEKQKYAEKDSPLISRSQNKQNKPFCTHLRYPSSYNHLNSNNSLTPNYNLKTSSGSIKNYPNFLSQTIPKKRCSQQLNLVFKKQPDHYSNTKNSLISNDTLVQSQVEIQVPSSESDIQQDQMTARFNYNQQKIIEQDNSFYSSQLQSSATSLGKNIKTKKIKNIKLQNFILGPCKGKGRYGKVYMVIEKSTGAIFALKQVSLQSIQKITDQFISELKLLLFFIHPYITKAYGYFVENNNFYIIMEYMNEGNLYELIKKQGHLPEIEASIKIYQVGQALSTLHKYNIIHRDMKPENIVMSFGVCKICDFGWTIRSHTRRQTNCGTLDYMSPQIIEGCPYNNSIDLWSTGVLLYQMLVGKAPFYNISVKQTARKIKQCSFSFPSNISENSRYIIECFLRKDPQERKQINQILGHQFFNQARQMNIF